MLDEVVACKSVAPLNKHPNLRSMLGLHPFLSFFSAEKYPLNPPSSSSSPSRWPSNATIVSPPKAWASSADVLAADSSMEESLHLAPGPRTAAAALTRRLSETLVIDDGTDENAAEVCCLGQSRRR